MALAALAACGGGDDHTQVSATPDAAMACDAIAQTGCQVGQKCTWVVDIDADPANKANEVGNIGCVAAGPLQAGDGCAEAQAGVYNGTDACGAGLLCLSSSCKPICDPQVLDGVPLTGSCQSKYACATYGGIFASTGAPAAGVCEPSCDPLTQKLAVGSLAPACGSPDPARPTMTCIPSASFLSFHCAPLVGDAGTRTDRDPPVTANDGSVYRNGCAPGFIPFYDEDASGAMTTVCTGLCAPLKVDATIAADPAHRTDARGDAGARGKLPGDSAPVAGHATCAPNIKGSQPAQDRRFLWFPLAGGDPGHAVASPFNDTVGVCYAYDKFLTVTIPGKPDKAAEKSCAELPATAPDNDPYGSARDNGCYPLSESRTARPRGVLGLGPGARHAFE